MKSRGRVFLTEIPGIEYQPGHIRMEEAGEFFLVSHFVSQQVYY
jgi:hypothetical protein